MCMYIYGLRKKGERLCCKAKDADGRGDSLHSRIKIWLIKLAKKSKLVFQVLFRVAEKKKQSTFPEHFRRGQ